VTEKSVFPHLELTSSPVLIADPSELEALQLAEGFQLPPSYRDFATRFGYGLLCDLLIIYIPMEGEGDSLRVRHQELRETMEQTLEDGLFEFEPDGSPELVSRLLPFGISENGHTLAWDPTERTGSGECMIYVIGSKFLAVRRATPDLYSFIEHCLDERVRKMLGSGYAPLPARFRPMKAGWEAAWGP
jgi:hypothetical protein